MKKSEIKSAKNQELVEYLICTAFTSAVAKSTKETAKRVCEELLARGVIDNAEKLFNVWLG